MHRYYTKLPPPEVLADLPEEVGKLVEEHHRTFGEWMRMKTDYEAMTLIEWDLNAAIVRAREHIPSLEAAVRADNEELAEILGRVQEILARRAMRKGIINWLVEQPMAFTPVPYAPSGMGAISEDTALRVLLGSTAQTEEVGAHG